VSPSDDVVVGPREQPSHTDPEGALVALYDMALPQVYGYLLPRCGSVSIAEEVTAETFMAAVTAAKLGTVPDLTLAWLVGVARHKLVDHWRRMEREDRSLAAVHGGQDTVDDPWDARIDADVAHTALSALPPPQRAALTLRYLDGLPVAEVAGLLGRSVHATETLLVRARAAFRRAYEESDSNDA
jgi:RNA polymerase sigma-70 factor, ECF subfamily